MRIKIICGILALMMISAGVFVAIDSDTPPVVVIPPDSELESTLMERPSEGGPSTLDPKECLYIAAGELQRSGGFRASSVGASTSMGVSQGVASERTVVGSNSFKQSTSYSALVKFGEQLYCWGENYLSRSPIKVNSLNNVSWANTANKYDKEGWLNKIGYRNTGLSGYILNDKTIFDAQLEGFENGIYTFRYKLDTKIAPYYVLYEMRNNSGSKGFAEFAKAEVVVTMDENFQVKTFTTDCEYKVPMMGGVNCKESLTETFFDIGYKGDLPEKEFFEGFFDADITTTKPIEPTALDVLMDMFAPYVSGGEKLNASVTVSNNEQKIVSALVSASLDIENTDNIAVDVKVGDGLYVSYLNKQLFVTYQDFKASTTLDGVMDFVSTLLPILGETEQGTSFDAEALLAGMNFKTENGICTVNLPIELGDLKADVNLYAIVENDTYRFEKATATIGNVVLEIEPIAQWTVPERSGEYPEILGLTQILNDGKIAVNVQLGSICADVMFDVYTTSLYAKMGDIYATLQNNTLYAVAGGAKVKVDLSDIGKLTEALKPFLGVDSVSMPSIGLNDVLTTLSNISATATENGVVLSAEIESLGLKADISLVSKENGWNLQNINVKFGDIDVAVTPTEQFDVPELGDIDKYVDVTEVASTFVPTIASLLNATGYAADFDLTVAVADKSFEVAGSLVLDADKNIAVDATIFEGATSILQANVIYANDTVFLTANGIKVAFSVASIETGSLDINAIASKLNVQSELLNELMAKINEVVVAVKQFDVKNLEIASLVESLTYQDNTLRLVANGDVLSLETIDVTISSINNALSVKLSDFKFASLTLNLNATIGATEKTVTVPSPADYVLNLKTEIAGIGVTLSADIFNMDIAAKVTVLNDTIDVRFVNNTVYAKLGNVAVKLTVEDIANLLAKLNNGNSSLESLDVAALLAGLKLDLTSDTPSIALETEQFALSLNFVRDNNILFNNISATIGEQTIVVELSDSRVTPLDISGSFLEAAPLLDRILGLVDTFKDAAGISANLETQIEVNDNLYTAAIQVSFNKGLHAVATISDQTRALAVLDCYYVNDTVYVDVNGLRAAVKVDTVKDLVAKLGTNTVAEDADVLAIIQSVKGISPVVDSVLNVVVNVLNNYKNIVIADVVQSVSYDNGTWTVGLDGTTLGVSKFTVSLDGATPAVGITNLTIGDVTINKLHAAVAVNDTEVVAPTDDYTTDIQVSVGDIATAYLNLDLYNLTVTGRVDVWNTSVDLLLKDGTVYLVCGQARLSLSLDEIDSLIAEIEKFAQLNTSGSFNVDVASILNSITKTDTESGYQLGLTVGGIDICLGFNGTTLDTATISVGKMEISASLASELELNTVDTNADFVSVVTLLQTYSDSIAELINATGYKVDANGNVTIGDKTVGIVATVVYNKTEQGALGDIYAKAALSYNGIRVVNAEVWLVDNTLYALVDGLRLAINLPSSTTDSENVNAKKTLEETLAPVYGYNAHLDTILDLIQNVVAKVNNGDVNANSMLKGLTLSTNESSSSTTLTASIDGAQFCGISQFDVALAKEENGLSASISNLAMRDIALCFSAKVVANDIAVAVPNIDWTTNILVQLDENNTLFANLDLQNGIYKFKLGDMNIMYSDKTIKVNKGNDVKVLANIDIIAEIVERIDDIVKHFGSSEEGTTILDENGKSKLLSVDLKDILNTLEITTGNNTVNVSLTAMKLPVSLEIVGGEEPQIAGITVKIDLLKKEFVAKPNFDNTVAFDDFADTTDYIAIDEVLQDYMEPIDALIHTNSWRFDFNEDSEIVVQATDTTSTTYILASGSYIEFYYNTACKDKFTLRACVDIKKVVDGKYNDFVVLDAIYQDGRIFLTYNSTLKATVSIDSIKECASLVDDLKAVIPQIDELIARLRKAKDEAENNVSTIDYSTIIQSVSYEEGKFSLTLNASAILSDLGDITVTASKTASTMTLECLQLSYGENNPHSSTINVVLKGVTVSASDLVEDPASDLDRDRYAAVADINDYFNKNGNIDQHMRFDSLKQLLSAVVNTADDTTFSIDGTVVADLSLIGIIKENVTMDLSARVDIFKNDEENASVDDTVFVTVKLSRPKQNFGSAINIAFNDYGGDSYLYFNGESKTITIIRNSYKLDWGIKMKERDYVAENITVEEFSANAVDYILQMVNFSSWINDLITKPSEEEATPYGLEDVFKWYSYSQEEQQFSVDLDLKPMNSNLGAVNVNILHKIDTVDVTKETEEGIETIQKDVYTLTNVNGTMKLLKEKMTVTLNLNLDQAPVYGDATYFVKNTVFWNKDSHTPNPISSK